MHASISSRCVSRGSASWPLARSVATCRNACIYILKECLERVCVLAVAKTYTHIQECLHRDGISVRINCGIPLGGLRAAGTACVTSRIHSCFSGDISTENACRHKSGSLAKLPSMRACGNASIAQRGVPHPLQAVAHTNFCTSSKYDFNDVAARGSHAAMDERR